MNPERTPQRSVVLGSVYLLLKLYLTSGLYAHDLAKMCTYSSKGEYVFNIRQFNVYYFVSSESTLCMIYVLLFLLLFCFVLFWSPYLCGIGHY